MASSRSGRFSSGIRIPIRVSGFSVVELLTVLAVIGILIGLGLVSLNAHTRAARLSAAGTHCANLFESARDTAILRRTPVAVAIFPASPRAPAALTALEYQSSSQTWARISKWEKLPFGVVFDPTMSTGVNSALGENSQEVTPALSPMEYAGATYASGGSDGYAYLVFLPSGALLQQHSHPGLLRLVEGVGEGGPILRTGSPENFVDLVINPWTGRLKIVRP